jgi:hypothetical protein
VSVLPVTITIHLGIPFLGAVPVRGVVFERGVEFGESHLPLLQLLGNRILATDMPLMVWNPEAFVIATLEGAIRHDDSLVSFGLVLLQHLVFLIVEDEVILGAIPHVVLLVGSELLLRIRADDEYGEM